MIQSSPGMGTMSKAGGVLKQAIDADRSGNIKTAVELYHRSNSLVKRAIELGLPSQMEKDANSKLQNIQTRIDELISFINTQPYQPQTPPQVNLTFPSPQFKKTEGPKGVPEKPGSMNSAIMVKKPNISFKDVAGLDAAKQSLYEAVIMPIKLPNMFKGPVVPWKGILLYGPPGTGKSYLAKAVAGEANQSTFLKVDTSDLTSKWVGESEKLIKALFQTARSNRPAIVFIDEIDSLVSERGEGDSESGRRMKTEFLVQMDGVGNDNKGIIVIAATNLPWALDPAIRRRFEKRVYIPLPDKKARLCLIDNLVKAANTNLKDTYIQYLADNTHGFSGADINILIRDALMQPIRDIQRAEYFKQVTANDTQGKKRDGLWVPCSRRDSGAVKTTWDKIDPNSLAQPVTTVEHFNESLKKARRSVSKEDIQRYKQWTIEFGEEGS